MQIADRTFQHPNRWALVLGTGLALYGIHWAKQPLLNYLFLPQIGLIIIVVCLFLYYMKHPQKPDFGSKYVWIPMLVIVASIMVWIIIDFSMKTIAGAFYSISLFAVYLVSRQLGQKIFMAFIPFVIIVAISCIYNGIAHPGEPTGGIITNYCASVGFMIFGTIVNKFKWQWVLATVTLIALFFSGTLEALFAVAVLGIIVLARRDWSRKLLIPVSLVAVAILALVTLGHLDSLWGKRNLDITWDLITGKAEVTHTTLDIATTGRWSNIVRRINDIQPLGRGFWVTMPKRTDSSSDTYHEYSSPNEEPVHNVPLIIVDQIGPVAGLAWLFVTMFCLIKTKWKYAWATILILSVFDHYIWTQFAPYWWTLVGVSTTTILKNDYIFKSREVTNE